MNQKLKFYEEARDCVKAGDVLLWRPTSWFGWFIALGTRTPYSHAGLAAWHGNRLYALEMLQGTGGRHEALSKQIALFPGRCEVWRPTSPSYNGEGAASEFMWILGARYGWSDFMQMTVLLFSKWLHERLYNPPFNSDDPDIPRVCSSGVHWGCRTGGGVALTDKPDLLVSPGDLAKSSGLAYQFTLTI